MSESAFWRKLILDLQAVMTVAEIAEAVGVNDRQVWRWKCEGDRPIGMTAIRVYTLHVKRCPAGQCPADHVTTAGVSITS